MSAQASYAASLMFVLTHAGAAGRHPRTTLQEHGRPKVDRESAAADEVDELASRGRDSAWPAA
jgi:hypothetical protein